MTAHSHTPTSVLKRMTAMHHGRKTATTTPERPQVAATSIDPVTPSRRPARAVASSCSCC